MIPLNLLLKKVYCNRLDFNKEKLHTKNKVTQICNSENESIHIVNLRAKIGAGVQRERERETCMAGRRGQTSKFKSFNENDQQLFFSLVVKVLVILLVH